MIDILNRMFGNEPKQTVDVALYEDEKEIKPATIEQQQEVKPLNPPIIKQQIHTNKVIVVTEDDGSCSIIRPIIYDGMRIEHLASGLVEKGKKYRIVDKSLLPQDNLFFEAWTDEKPTQTVDIDIEKAKQAFLKRLRQRRNEKFVELGFPNKLDADLEKAIIPQEKRQKLDLLRNLPTNTNLKNIETISQLKNAWPTDLLGEF